MSKVKRNDQLFQLVKSLTPSEKRYFKRFASLQVSKKKPSFLVLFEILDGAEVNDEEKIKSSLSKKFGSINFSELKYYLYNHILKALHNFNYDKDLSYQLQNQVIFAKILYDKNLIGDARKMSKRTAEMAERYNDPMIQYQSLQVNLLTEFHQYEKKESIAETMSSYKKMVKALRILEGESAYQMEYYKRFIEYKYKHVLVHGELQDLFNDLSGEDFTVGISNDQKSKLTTLFEYNFEALKFLIKEDHEGAMRTMAKSINFFDANEDFRKRHIKHYLSLRNNYAFTLSAAGRVKECAEQQFQARQFILNEFKSKAENHVMYIIFSYMEEVKSYIILNDLKTARERAQELENGYMVQLSAIKSYELKFIYLNALCYFKQGDHKKSIQWLGKIILEKNTYVFPYRMLMEAILLLFANYWTIGHHELISAVYQNARKLFLTNLDSTEQKELEIIMQIMHETTKASDLISKMKNAGIKEPERFNTEVGCNFNLLEWSRSLIQA